jgi:hypothetical protein
VTTTILETRRETAGGNSAGRVFGEPVVHGDSWHPAVDVTRVVLGGRLMAAAALLVARSVLRRYHETRVARSR